MQDSITPGSRRRTCSALLAVLLGLVVGGANAGQYFPPRGEWARCVPAECGMDAAALAEAVAFAQAHESPAPRDQAEAWAQTFGKREPHFGGILGPMQERAAVNGLVIHRGKVVAEFGDTRRVDMCHSVAKSFLSAVVGIAWQQGLIRDVEGRVADDLPSGLDLFADPHNRPISWEMLLQQRSDWRGTLWGKPDWADRPTGETPDDWPKVPRNTPGSTYEYNDVRINVLALAALHVLRRPLPEVLREAVMDPIGASRRWRWHGYDNSWIELDGQRMQSVSGGGHWGGGMFIDAWDMARFGYLYLRDGEWDGRQLIAREWIARSRRPSPTKDDYGYANWFLNPGRRYLPSAPESSVTFRGNGQNIIHIDQENDLVVVLRWIADDAAIDGFLGRVLAARRELP